MIRRSFILIVILVAAICVAQPLPSHPSPGSSAFFKSLLIPGWGQLAQHRPQSATIFFTSEAALILTSVGMQTYGGWLKDDYRSLAALYAGIPDGGNRSHTMYVDMGNWRTAQEFNLVRQRDREFSAQYLNPGDQWRWTDDATRTQFKNLRLRSDQMLDKVKFAVGAVVINHFVSAIEAASYARKKSSSKKVAVLLNGTSQEPNLSVVMSW